jgi:hypothetical protein
VNTVVTQWQMHMVIFARLHNGRVISLHLQGGGMCGLLAPVAPGTAKITKKISQQSYLFPKCVLKQEE